MPLFKFYMEVDLNGASVIMHLKIYRSVVWYYLQVYHWNLYKAEKPSVCLTVTLLSHQTQ